MSPFLLEKTAYVGQLNVYGKSAEVLEELMGVRTTSVQVNKVVKYYGEQCVKDDHILKQTLGKIKDDEKMYLMMDGSFVLTKEDSWKEVKAMRLFNAKDCKHVEGKSSYIKDSQYLSVVDEASVFKNKVDTLIANYKINQAQLIIITDGAPWIKNYVEDSFEKATSILDFYHASEYLHKFKLEAIKDKNKAEKWVKKQLELLKENGVKKVIKNIEKIALDNSCKSAADVIVKYYQTNINRMNYKTYEGIGIGIIGSGAMESTHRTLIQSRCKLSGQLWSRKGLQNILDLRTIYMNKDHKKIREISLKKAA